MRSRATFPEPLDETMHGAGDPRAPRDAHPRLSTAMAVRRPAVRGVVEAAAATARWPVAPMLWEERGVGALVRHAPAADALHRQGTRAAEDLRRPGGDRDPERAAVQRDARRRWSSRRPRPRCLQVISSSVADTAAGVRQDPATAASTCSAATRWTCCWCDEQGQLQIAAYVGNAHDVVAATFPAPVDMTPAGRAIRERRLVHLPRRCPMAPMCPT